MEREARHRAALPRWPARHRSRDARGGGSRVLARTRQQAPGRHALREAGVDAVGARGAWMAARPRWRATRMRHGSGAVGRGGGRASPAARDACSPRAAPPVLASIGAEGGQMLNIKRRRSCAPPSPLHSRARALLLLSDTPGSSSTGAWCRRLGTHELAAALRSPGCEGRHAARAARAAAAAIEAGAQRVVIGAWAGPGTLTALLLGRRRWHHARSPRHWRLPVAGHALHRDHRDPRPLRPARYRPRLPRGGGPVRAGLQLPARPAGSRARVRCVTDSRRAASTWTS